MNKSSVVKMVAKPKRLPLYIRPKQKVKFEGRIDALKGHIYNCTDSCQADLYTKMTKEIAGYTATSLKIAIKTLTVPTNETTEWLPANASAAQKRHWEKRIDEISKKGMILEENMKNLFSIVWGQVSDVLKHRIQVLDDFKRMNAEGDSLALLAVL